MACSSSSSSSNSSLAQRRNYDVFISFRGKDTRYNITDHLFGALQGKDIFAFRDDTNLKKGESIAPELLHAIEGSHVFVVIFSKNYASSTWCLRELEKILESAQVLGKRVLPVFYDVDPSDVRHQKGSFDEAFKKHEERFKHDLQIVQRWREALTHVANLSGFDLRDKPQYIEIQTIVEEIIDILLPKDLVGIHTPIEELEKLFQLDSVDDISLARLRESPRKDIMNVLRLRFDGLEKNEKEIFLHIACFFNNHAFCFVRDVLNCCGLQPDIGLRVLVDKSLITVFNGNLMNFRPIEMHSLLQELGRNIVRENSVKEPTKWSRLWLPKHLYIAISENMENNVEAVAFNLRINKEIQVNAELLSKLSRLKLLRLIDVDLEGSSICLSNELRYIFWNNYPFMSLPLDFHPNQLVELNLSDSNIKILCEDEKYLPKLKTLDLSGSKNLIKMPNFEKIPNLEKLYLEGCVKLVHMDPSIGLLRKLVVLNLKDCKNLVILPNIIFRINSLKDVNLSGCSKMVINQWSVEKPSYSMKWNMLGSCVNLILVFVV